jgi:hypothetical protein
MRFPRRGKPAKQGPSAAPVDARGANIGAIGHGNNQTNLYLNVNTLRGAALWGYGAIVVVVIVLVAWMPWRQNGPSQRTVVQPKNSAAAQPQTPANSSGTTNDPITVSVRADPALEIGVDGIFALPEAVPSNPSTLTASDVINLIKSQHGAMVDTYRAELILVGNSDTPVVITGIRVHTVKYDPTPLSGTLLDLPPQGEFPLVKACSYIDTQFDAEIYSPLQKTDSNCFQGHGGEYFSENYTSLQRGETAVFDIAVTDSGASKYEYPVSYSTEASGDSSPWPYYRVAPSGVYEWEFKIDTTVNGKSASMTVDDNGAPFKVTTRAPNYATTYDEETASDGSGEIGRHK